MPESSSFDAITETVERLRAERHPELPAELVAKILRIEAAHIEDRGPAAGKIQAALDEALGGTS